LILGGIIFQKFHAPQADIAFRHVSYPQEGQVVLIDNEPEIRESILDLHPAKKLYAAIDGAGDFFFQKIVLLVRESYVCTILGQVVNPHFP